MRAWIKKRLHDRRFIKNALLSISGWVLVQQVIFHVLIYKWHMNSQEAKVLLSPIGIPVGLTIQWLVFGDRVRSLWRLGGWLAAALGPGWKYPLAKLTFFLVNQATYAFFLHQVGLPPKQANTVAAPFVSILSYYVMLWVTKQEKQKTQS